MLRRTVRRFTGQHPPPPPPPPQHAHPQPAHQAHAHAQMPPSPQQHPSAGMSAHGASDEFHYHPPRSLPFMLSPFFVVPQGTTFVIERFGKFNRVVSAGPALRVPLVERIRAVYSTREANIFVPFQTATTRDRVNLNIDGVIALKLGDAKDATYNVASPIGAIATAARRALVQEVAKFDLDDILYHQRDALSQNVFSMLGNESAEWGIDVRRFTVRDVLVPDAVRHAIDAQAEAERRRKHHALEVEAEADARIAAAKADRVVAEEAAAAQKLAALAVAEGGAESLQRSTDAVVQSLETLAKAMEKSPAMKDAVAFRLAEQYIEALANNTKLVTVGECPDKAIKNALSLFENVSSKNK